MGGGRRVLYLWWYLFFAINFHVFAIPPTHFCQTPYKLLPFAAIFWFSPEDPYCVWLKGEKTVGSDGPSVRNQKTKFRGRQKCVGVMAKT